MTESNEPKAEVSESRGRLLDAAESLFMERGYKAVTLRHIAEALDIKQASIYHHTKNKESLFVEVVERSFTRHQEGLRAAINGESDDDVEAQLRAAAKWMLAQKPVDFGRMINSDMTALKDDGQRGRLMDLGYQSLLVPIEEIFAEAFRNGCIRTMHPTTLAGGVISLISALQWAPWYESFDERVQEANRLIDVFVNGLRK